MLGRQPMAMSLLGYCLATTASLPAQQFGKQQL